VPETDFDELRRRVVGRPLPGGTFSVAEYERWLSHDALQSPPLPDGVLHPVWVLLGALRGMGLTLEELTAIADGGEGSLFGETELEQREPLRSDVVYSVRGSITDLVRRQTRKMGIVDFLTFRLEILEPGGALAAASTQVFILPRERDSRAA
jgi:hypothetical protein